MKLRGHLIVGGPISIGENLSAMTDTEAFTKAVYYLANKYGVTWILSIPGVFELVSEDLNNEAIALTERKALPVIEFTATIDQVKQLIINAVNHSIPMGLGHLHHVQRDHTTDEVRLPADLSWINVDYFSGRMVKLRMRHLGDDKWRIADDRLPDPDYHSWAPTYPTYEALLASVPGIEVTP